MSVLKAAGGPRVRSAEQADTGWWGVGAMSATLARVIRMIRCGRRPGDVGWAARRTWNTDGAHEFVGWKTTQRKAEIFRDADAAYWRRGGMRPTYDMVQISWYEFREHHREHRFCTAGDCTVAQLLISGSGPDGAEPAWEFED